MRTLATIVEDRLLLFLAIDFCCTLKDRRAKQKKFGVIRCTLQNTDVKSFKRLAPSFKTLQEACNEGK